jgi:zinc transporter ZupT
VPLHRENRDENRVRAAIAAVLTAMALLVGAGSAFAAHPPKADHPPKPPKNCHQAGTC